MKIILTSKTSEYIIQDVYSLSDPVELCLTSLTIDDRSSGIFE